QPWASAHGRKGELLESLIKLSQQRLCLAPWAEAQGYYLSELTEKVLVRFFYL
ncbi:hypothetical protein SapgrDRAFT_2987, partial [Saprospira grandis DSM 2844]